MSVSGEGVPLVVITRAVPTESGGAPEIDGCRVRMAAAEPGMTRAELLASIRGAAGVVSMFNDRVDAEFLAAAGPGLKVVCNYAVGVDNIDLPACRRAGVPVAHLPDAVTEGTANMAMGLLLCVARRLPAGDAYVRSGAFASRGNGFPIGWMGMHLAGQTMLIVGAGRIGLAVARRARAFGMRVRYVARSAHREFEGGEISGQRVELDAGLAEADVVSLHVPLTAQTRHLLDRRRIGLLKPTAIVINTARGAVVEEAALIEALEAGRIWGAGLDVFEHEPEVPARLRALDNVVLSPHVGSSERYWRIRMTELACANVAAGVAGRPLVSPVPEWMYAV